MIEWKENIRSDVDMGKVPYLVACNTQAFYREGLYYNVENNM